MDGMSPDSGAASAVGTAPKAPPVAETLRQMLWKRFRRHRLAMVSLVLLALLTLACFASPLAVRKATLQDVDGVEEVVFGPGLLRYTESGEDEDLANRFQSSSLAHPLGTDHLGRDVLIRLLYGGRISISVGIVAAVFSSILGILVGALAGYFGGGIDTLLMRFTDAMLSVPILPLMIVISLVDLEKIGLGWLVHMELAGLRLESVARILFVVIVFEWMGVARLVRASILSLKERDFVMAARALGGTSPRIILVHLIPNAMAPIIVATTLAAGSIILYESVLSYLGLGIMPPTASWGNMLNGSQEYLRKAPMLAFWPGMLIWITVTAFNFLGDGLRDALDPRFISEKAKG